MDFFFFFFFFGKRYIRVWFIARETSGEYRLWETFSGLESLWCSVRLALQMSRENMESWSISASQFLLKEVEFGVGEVKREIVQPISSADEFSGPIFWTKGFREAKDIRSYTAIFILNTVYWNEIRVSDWLTHSWQLNPIGWTFVVWIRENQESLDSLDFSHVLEQLQMKW